MAKLPDSLGGEDLSIKTTINTPQPFLRVQAPSARPTNIAENRALGLLGGKLGVVIRRDIAPAIEDERVQTVRGAVEAYQLGVSKDTLRSEHPLFRVAVGRGISEAEGVKNAPVYIQALADHSVVLAEKFPNDPIAIASGMDTERRRLQMEGVTTDEGGVTTDEGSVGGVLDEDAWRVVNKDLTALIPSMLTAAAKHGREIKAAGLDAEAANNISSSTRPITVGSETMTITGPNGDITNQGLLTPANELGQIHATLRNLAKQRTASGSPSQTPKANSSITRNGLVASLSHYPPGSVAQLVRASNIRTLIDLDALTKTPLISLPDRIALYKTLTGTSAEALRLEQAAITLALARRRQSEYDYRVALAKAEGDNGESYSPERARILREAQAAHPDVYFESRHATPLTMLRNKEAIREQARHNLDLTATTPSEQREDMGEFIAGLGGDNKQQLELFKFYEEMKQISERMNKNVHVQTALAGVTLLVEKIVNDNFKPSSKGNAPLNTTGGMSASNRAEVGRLEASMNKKGSSLKGPDKALVENINRAFNVQLIKSLSNHLSLHNEEEWPALVSEWVTKVRHPAGQLAKYITQYPETAVAQMGRDPLNIKVIDQAQADKFDHSKPLTGDTSLWLPTPQGAGTSDEPLGKMAILRATKSLQKTHGYSAREKRKDELYLKHWQPNVNALDEEHLAAYKSMANNNEFFRSDVDSAVLAAAQLTIQRAHEFEERRQSPDASTIDPETAPALIPEPVVSAVIADLSTREANRIHGTATQRASLARSRKQQEAIIGFGADAIQSAKDLWNTPPGPIKGQDPTKRRNQITSPTQGQPTQGQPTENTDTYKLLQTRLVALSDSGDPQAAMRVAVGAIRNPGGHMTPVEIQNLKTVVANVGLKKHTITNEDFVTMGQISEVISLQYGSGSGFGGPTKDETGYSVNNYYRNRARFQSVLDRLPPEHLLSVLTGTDEVAILSAYEFARNNRYDYIPLQDDELGLGIPGEYREGVLAYLSEYPSKEVGDAYAFYQASLADQARSTTTDSATMFNDDPSGDVLQLQVDEPWMPAPEFDVNGTIEVQSPASLLASSQRERPVAGSWVPSNAPPLASDDKITQSRKWGDSQSLTQRQRDELDAYNQYGIPLPPEHPERDSPPTDWPERRAQ